MLRQIKYIVRTILSVYINLQAIITENTKIPAAKLTLAICTALERRSKFMIYYTSILYLLICFIKGVLSPPTKYSTASLKIHTAENKKAP